MGDEYRIHLNFLPVVGPLPAFRVFRKPRSSEESRPDDATVSYSFSRGIDRNDREFYWVKPSASDGFTEYTAQPDENNDLTLWALTAALREAVRQKLHENDYILESRGFLNEVSLIIGRHPEGQELLVLQPYLLRETRQFGCLADFRFDLKQGVLFSRRVQQLSLSLDPYFKRNVDCYIDRTAKIRSCLKQREAVFTALCLPGSNAPVSLSADFISLPARRLRSKTYVFANNRESRSQFSGLKDFGPLEPLDAPPNLLFLFREQDRIAARKLAAALRGTKGKERFSFPGFQALFKAELQIDSNPVILPNLTEEAMVAALATVQSRQKAVPNTLPVLVLPVGDDNGYLAHKAGFSHAGIATQVCTLRVILDENALKWAVANIALQIFCKAGGQPWKVRPSAERTLIVGISQSHKTRSSGEARKVEKYFAFTVMTDNSGLFQEVRVLGEGGDKAEYLRQLRENLRGILSDGSQHFARVVVHTSFKLKRDEMDAIQQTVSEAAVEDAGSKCRFAVVKVNQMCRFFGVNRQVNSLVPFEGTIVKLGFREYLVWFEGIFPDKTTVTKAYPGPTHIKIIRVGDGQGVADDDLLQDIVNLSGANWRGFNAKSAPVSVFYCHLVAKLVHNFHERGLPLPEIPLIRPWFL